MEPIKRDTLIIDCNFICYQAMMKLSNLSHDNHPTGVIYGFLDRIQVLYNRFKNPNFLFAWDSRESYRRKVYPKYKSKEDKKIDEDLINLMDIGKPQFTILRLEILPRLGFKNIFIQHGLEADDMIAKIVKDHWSRFYNLIIVTGDNDLYQLLQPGVSIYHPSRKTMYTEKDFIEEKKISPMDWPWVKAVGGCVSDNVKGIKGVAEGYAIKYLLGTAPNSIKEKIREFDPTFNFSLVRLPHEKTRQIEIREDDLNIKEFEGVCLDYGLHSFLSKNNYNKWKQILSKE